MTETKYTAETLAALPGRKLDLLATEIIMGGRVPWMGRLVPLGEGELPLYSTDLNLVTLLEKELAERKLDEDYAAVLFDAIFPAHLGDIYEHKLTPLITASAKSRTIAAILTAQHSPIPVH